MIDFEGDKFESPGDKSQDSGGEKVGKWDHFIDQRIHEVFK